MKIIKDLFFASFLLIMTSFSISYAQTSPNDSTAIGAAPGRLLTLIPQAFVYKCYGPVNPAIDSTAGYSTYWFDVHIVNLTLVGKLQYGAVPTDFSTIDTAAEDWRFNTQIQCAQVNYVPFGLMLWHVSSTALGEEYRILLMCAQLWASPGNCRWEPVVNSP